MAEVETRESITEKIALLNQELEIVKRQMQCAQLIISRNTTDEQRKYALKQIAKFHLPEDSPLAGLIEELGRLSNNT